MEINELELQKIENEFNRREDNYKKLEKILRYPERVGLAIIGAGLMMYVADSTPEKKYSRYVLGFGSAIAGIPFLIRVGYNVFLIRNNLTELEKLKEYDR